MKFFMKSMNMILVALAVTMIMLNAYGTYKSYNLDPELKDTFVFQCSQSMGTSFAAVEYCSCMINEIESAGLIAGGYYDCVADAKIASWLSSLDGMMASRRCAPQGLTREDPKGPL